MHELSLVRTLLIQVTRLSENKKVVGITVEVGRLSCVDPYRLGFCFDLCKSEVASSSAYLRDADLRILRAPGQALCRHCNKAFELSRIGSACMCGSYDYTVISGQQLLLTEIEFA